ncbi:DUF2059 domain-containing protein [Microbulbifer hainanensis]|uniref:DUF2059 domain-containing protein n=1 Tax=Microbulbifer hainanensis TaxID=2735675 RepID=UPI001865C29D
MPEKSLINDLYYAPLSKEFSNEELVEVIEFLESSTGRKFIKAQSQFLSYYTSAIGALYSSKLREWYREEINKYKILITKEAEG